MNQRDRACFTRTRAQTSGLECPHQLALEVGGIFGLSRDSPGFTAAQGEQWKQLWLPICGHSVRPTADTNDDKS
ncbi:hypothetical protein RRG08_058889 [Elysia crispata]|uniref:Uncharacterized protein n=1 Tax=Elysia crispata TaxID=231223 RepID=A0AAE1CQ76_9GAST|nr:hypothetical protein RRG08_058889 [Elysia crispata]